MQFVIATTGRWEDVLAQVSDLEAAAAAGLPVTVVLVSQGGRPPAAVESLCRSRDWPQLLDAGRGASRARNAGLRALPPAAGHVIFTNDHARYPVQTVRVLAEATAAGSDVVIGCLLERDKPRYEVAASHASLDRDNVWDAIEPATAISRALVDRLGGLDEQLGAGAACWGSSALGDLLLRVSQIPHTVAWLPEFLVHGPGARRAVDTPALNRKMRAYGRGYGFVLRRWHYPLLRRVGSVAKPPLSRHYSVGPDEMPLQTRLQLSLGRLEGITGRTFGWAGPVRQPGDLAA